MPFINVEIKARTSNADEIRIWLMENNADFKGTDWQTDTYYNVRNGRLKLRQGNIENNLIFYLRPDQEGPKQSDFQLLKVDDADLLSDMLTRSIGIKAIVKKKRDIYYIENVKFHIDEVPGLGDFVEIEAGNVNNNLSREQLLEQCNYYMKALKIEYADLLDRSYSDMILEKAI
jgi:adenylate cyclase class 2